MVLPVIEAVIETVKIPSTKAEITIKQMLAKDQKLLLVAKADAGDDEQKSIAVLKAIKQVVQNCLVTPGIDVEQLALFDVEYLFIKLHELSVSNIVEVAYRDNEEYSDYLTAKDKFENEPPAPSEDGKIKLKTKPPAEPAVYNFKIPLADVVVKFVDGIEKEIKSAGNVVLDLRYPPAVMYTDKTFLDTSGIKTLDRLVLSCIDHLNVAGSVVQFQNEAEEEKQKFIDNLPAPAYEAIQKFLTNLPYIFYEIKYTNLRGNEKKITLSKLTDFFQF